jgi:hypothetical protein
MRWPAFLGCIVVCFVVFLAGRMTAPGAVEHPPAAVTRGPAMPGCAATTSPALTADTVRAIVREELTAHAPEPAPAPAPASTEPSRDKEEMAGALEHARGVLTQRMADGRWTDEDREALREAMRGLQPTQAREILSVLFPAINSGKLVLETVDGPI